MKWNPFSFRQKKKLKFQDESSEFLFGTQKKKNINCKHALGFFLLMCHYIHILYFIWHFFVCIQASFVSYMQNILILWNNNNSNNSSYQFKEWNISAGSQFFFFFEFRPITMLIVRKEFQNAHPCRTT